MEARLSINELFSFGDQMKIPVKDAEIIFNDDIISEVKGLIRDAAPAETVYLVTPYVKLDTRIKEAIEEAIQNKVEVIVLMRANADHSIDDVHWLLKQRVIVKQLENLHAKVYVSQKLAVIASMNLHTYSGSESKECGIKLSDPTTISQLRDHIDKKWKTPADDVDFLSAGKSQIKSTTVVSAPAAKSKTTEKAKGFCIRCAKPKTFNPTYPLCDDCYKEWAKYKNDAYKEKNCHRCGKPSDTSVAKPLCLTCFKETA